MENKTLTAVEWLVNKIYMVIPNEERNFLEGLREQAKQMEKEQIIDAFEIGWKDEDRIFYGEKYYKETFTSTPQGESPSAIGTGQS